jgi:hypothetical protein
MSTLPRSWQTKLREEQPDPSKWNKELTVLMDSSIEARPLHMPTNSDVRLKDSSMVIYRVRRKNGTNGDQTRYMELRAAGYTPVTIDDLENPQDLTAHISADKTEITEGVDLVWMKAKKEIHYGAMKFHNQRALQMTSPERIKAQDSVMRSVPLSPEDRAALYESRSYIPGNEEMEKLESRASQNNSIKKGSPQWNTIAEEAGKKGK